MAVTQYFHCRYCMVQEAHNDVGVVLVALFALWGGKGGIAITNIVWCNKRSTINGCYTIFPLPILYGARSSPRCRSRARHSSCAVCVGGGGLTRFGTAPNAWMVRGLLFLVIYVYVWIHIYKIDT